MRMLGSEQAVAGHPTPGGNILDRPAIQGDKMQDRAGRCFAEFQPQLQHEIATGQIAGIPFEIGRPFMGTAGTRIISRGLRWRSSRIRRWCVGSGPQAVGESVGAARLAGCRPVPDCSVAVAVTKVCPQLIAQFVGRASQRLCETVVALWLIGDSQRNGEQCLMSAERLTARDAGYVGESIDPGLELFGRRLRWRCERIVHECCYDWRTRGWQCAPKAWGV